MPGIRISECGLISISNLPQPPLPAAGRLFQREEKKGDLFADAELFEDAVQYLFGRRFSYHFSKGI